MLTSEALSVEVVEGVLRGTDECRKLERGKVGGCEDGE